MKLKRSLVKVLVLAMIATSCPLATMAQTTTTATYQNGKLDLDYAISRAQSSCDVKTVYGTFLEAYEELNQYNRDEFSPVYRQSELNEDTYDYKMEHINDMIGYDAMDLYTEIVYTRKQIEMAESSIVIKDRKLRQVEIMKKNGQSSQLDYQTAESELTNAKASLVGLQASLENAVMEFKNLTNMDITKYELEDKFVIEDVKITGVPSRHFEKSLEEFWRLKKEAIAIGELNLDLSVMGYNANGTSVTVGDYMKQEAQLKEGDYNIENLQETVYTTLQTQYNSLASYKEKIKTNEEKLKVAEENLRAAQIKLDRKTISQLEYEQTMLSKQSAECDLFKATIDYMKAKEIVETPTIFVMQNLM